MRADFEVHQVSGRSPQTLLMAILVFTLMRQPHLNGALLHTVFRQMYAYH